MSENRVLNRMINRSPAMVAQIARSRGSTNHTEGDVKCYRDWVDVGGEEIIITVEDGEDSAVQIAGSPKVHHIEGLIN